MNLLIENFQNVPRELLIKINSTMILIFKMLVNVTFVIGNIKNGKKIFLNFILQKFIDFLKTKLKCSICIAKF